MAHVFEAPDAEEDKNLSANSTGVKYIQSDTSECVTYFVRDDGYVDRTKGGGKIGKQFTPPAKTKYIVASAGIYASYLLRDDGVVDRLVSAEKESEIRCEDGFKYIAISSGDHASYFVREDGAVDRSTGKGKMTSTISAPESVKYVDVSAGSYATYLLRDDGKIDRTTGSGTISATIECGETGVTYIAISPQAMGSASDKHNTQTQQSYFVRSDGKADKTTGSAKIQFTVESEFSPYIAASSGLHASYLLRADGAIDRIVSEGTVELSINPRPGTQYTFVGAGIDCSYFLHSDGTADRTTSGGKIASTISPVPVGFKPESSSCSIM